MFLTALNVEVAFWVLGACVFIFVIMCIACQCVDKNSINKISDPEKRKYARNYYEEHGHSPYKTSESVGMAQLIGLISLLAILGVLIALTVTLVN